MASKFTEKDKKLIVNIVVIYGGKVAKMTCSDWENVLSLDLFTNRVSAMEIYNFARQGLIFFSKKLYSFPPPKIMLFPQF